jgi:mRNA-degrading endonuclease RelE of RelBE toxin-antitoxin system
MYTILYTDQFMKNFLKLDKSIQKRFERQINYLVKNPFIGKPLGIKYFRELKVMNYRLYYAINDKEILVLLVDTSTKKDQQKTIQEIKPKIIHLLNKKGKIFINQNISTSNEQV